jgi:hypothetical protein
VKRFIFLIIVFAAIEVSWCETDIGEEYITPLTYPKFSITGDYSLKRFYRGFADNSLHYSLENRFGVALSFEVATLKYMTAGALFTVSFSKKSKKEPTDLRLGLFLKPYMPLGDRFSFFGRLVGGLTLTLASKGMIVDYLSNTTMSFKDNYDIVFKGQKYMGTPFGGFGAATVGIDFFPLSRLGLAFEWGIRADAMHMGKNNVYENEKPEIILGAPSSFNYMMYEMPLSLTLHVIL